MFEVQVLCEILFSMHASRIIWRWWTPPPGCFATSPCWWWSRPWSDTSENNTKVPQSIQSCFSADFVKESLWRDLLRDFATRTTERFVTRPAERFCDKRSKRCSTRKKLPQKHSQLLIRKKLKQKRNKWKRKEYHTINKDLCFDPEITFFGDRFWRT